MFTEQQFIDILKAHDWFYAFAENRADFDAGRQSKEEIRLILNEQPELIIIYDEYRLTTRV